MMYLAGSWLVLQVVDTVSPWLALSDEFGRILLFILMVGLFPAAVLAWLFEWTPDGIRFDEEVEIDEAGAVVARRRLDRLIIGMLAIAVMYFAIDKFLPSKEGPRVTVSGRSIAVLPFEDISLENDQGYLAQGMADELRLELQRLDGLRVAGRTSSYAFAQNGVEVAGDALSVASILEGSVRKDGDQIRVSVQLIDSKDGFMIWSGSYDRKLQGIFDMQKEIAESVAGYLGVSLGVGDANAFKGAGTKMVEAYESYLLAQSIPNGPGSHQASMPLLERATEIDPNYGVAWSAMAIKTLNRQWSAVPSAVPALLNRANQFAARGAELTPDSAMAQSILGIIRMYKFDWIGADQALRRATTVLSDRKMHGRYAVALLRSGRLAKAKEQFQLGERVEPIGDRPVPQSWHASLGQGLVDEARKLRSRLSQHDIFEDNLDLAFNEDNANVLKTAIRDLPKENSAYIHLYEPLLPLMDAPEQVLPLLEKVYQNETIQWPRKTHDLAMAAAYFGFPEFSLEAKRRDILQNSNRIAAIWYPVMSGVRRLPAFTDFVRELNLEEYWRAEGWADNCRSLGVVNFECL